MVVALLLTLTPAHAFEVLYTSDGTPIRFSSMPVSWHYDASEAPDALAASEQEKAVEEAFEAWMAVSDADVVFVEEANGDMAGTNPVFWVEDWEWDESLLAVTSTWATEEGDLVGFEMRINGSYQKWAVNADNNHMDLQNTITHEVGHAIGMDHNAGLETATMFPTAELGEVDKRALEADDEDGARFLYAASDELTAAACNTTASTSAASALPLVLALIARRRKA